MAAVHWLQGREAEPRTHSVRIAGTPTRLLEAGEGGDTVILLHGFGDSHATWRYVVPALARRHHVIAADLPGFGGSRAVAHRPLLDWYALWVEDLVAKVAPRGRATLVGNSLGGAVALGTALRTPLRVSRLVLVGCAGLGQGVPLWWRLVTAQMPLQPLLGPAVGALPRPVLQRLVGEVYARLVLHHPADVDAACVRDFAAYYRSRKDLHRLLDLGHDIVRELSSGRLTREAPALRVPTLLVWGTHDRLVPAAHGVELQRVVPSAQLYLMDDCGHCPQLERPAEFTGAVERFLRGRSAGNGARVVLADQLRD
jgi:pimeloyl-ACP methyl ester carboxylesterase